MKKVRVAIHGFGRIGRSILRALSTSRQDSPLEVVLVNDLAPLETCAYLFEYDSVFGPFRGQVETRNGALLVNGTEIPFHQIDPAAPLPDLTGVDILLECSGRATSRAVAEAGLQAGAGAVLISGPSDAADVTLVRGANDAVYTGQKIVSNASCTTNALAPLLRLLEDRFGVSGGHMNTIHCYTSSQPTIDTAGKDLARSRAAALSMVPTTSSATKLIDRVVPDLAGRITGSAVRVPVASVSAVDLVVKLKRQGADFKDALKAAVDASPVLGWTDKPLVSTDLRSRPESLVLAEPELITGPEFTRIFGWYDNEWGFSNRMIDVAQRMGAAQQ
ncbi:type I glyceraldehyde-3-phosphate dehydrogenase [Neptunicoccus sediminis]|uniref:type I glyceraldehyde-3-phosphate dehydrogenase n=1 Tax=Neptunicoccus sediminis TaxID=1892596 RepID=UPI000846280A|nr:glyceraldehyde 3-phosphate dehydrogenase NAD-binding domain-containing protein [Neptunicoccus sediminis]